MRKLTYLTSLAIFTSALLGCSCSCEKTQKPQEEKKDDQALFEETLNPTPPLPTSLLKLPGPPTVNLLATSPSNTAEFNDFISIMGQNGAVITMWSVDRRSWLWMYPPLNSQDFGKLRNWRIERSFRQEHFRFTNQQMGSCMQAYGNGVIQDSCDPNNLDQDFELLPTSTGSVFIKSVSQQRCLTYNAVSTAGYFTLTLDRCDDKRITPLHDQTFYLTPPLLSANPL
ncbi:cytolethal distending toxin subunit A/C [Glaesserella parasuis]|uniref:cytolethal distending toxin subunit A/C n=1 Tax=Glaesserella parasuis TaxID=738 RepID=UPI00094F4D00|nr:cytolethal distending toxin subunit A/C [Glaesserella parasuis]MCT8749523.1 toxin [Glaesserella parasuis]MDE4023148.1 toxin [Glaesserella parasuis]MDE4024961.1 toxin [Glaesserella parasuis]MDO9750761.1 cytolethal distending toxin subunit A/C [Glaesserella parasuis]